MNGQWIDYYNARLFATQQGSLGPMWGLIPTLTDEK